jgi:hypothetical protein
MGHEAGACLIFFGVTACIPVNMVITGEPEAYEVVEYVVIPVCYTPL